MRLELLNCLNYAGCKGKNCIATPDVTPGNCLNYAGCKGIFRWVSYVTIYANCLNYAGCKAVLNVAILPSMSRIALTMRDVKLCQGLPSLIMLLELP